MSFKSVRITGHSSQKCPPLTAHSLQSPVLFQVIKASQGQGDPTREREKSAFETLLQNGWWEAFGPHSKDSLISKVLPSY